MKGDRSGISLVSERVESIPTLLRQFQYLAPPKLSQISPRIVVTGVGSSEAHARFLQAGLAQLLGKNAHFIPFEQLLNPQFSASVEGSSLFIFSQGLSAQARRVLALRSKFAHTVLFTSCSEEGLERKNKPEALDLLITLRNEGASIISYPLEDEYELLVRVVGPFFGFYAAFMALQSMGARLELPGVEAIVEAVNRAAEAAQEYPEKVRSQCVVISSPESLSSQNIAFKFLEGIFNPLLFCSDFLHLPHGPFQCAVKQGAHVLMFYGGTPFEEELVVRAERMIRSTHLSFTKFQASLSPYVRILEYEMYVNALILREASLRKVNQREWPGKGLDGPLYEL